MEANKKDIGSMIKKGIAIYCEANSINHSKVTTEITAPSSTRGEWEVIVDFDGHKLSYVASRLCDVIENFLNNVTLMAQKKIQFEEARRKRLQFLIGNELAD